MLVRIGGCWRPMTYHILQGTKRAVQRYNLTEPLCKISAFFVQALVLGVDESRELRPRPKSRTGPRSKPNEDRIAIWSVTEILNFKTKDGGTHPISTPARPRVGG
ncbi:hypothetical protein EVAR_93668_1 [Eumeta japonica]|uniref:Uncharacterized protein n=1 Tax=Eumeta variegata TaxID=151549 RepID=A0A4C1TQP0_EUMVA|nr:hypothetical protein EVAR_93668_1 [Eumeta japonica]